MSLKSPLSEFPGYMGGWSGKDYPLDNQVVKTLKIDDYLNRLYRKGYNGLWLYIGYYASQQSGATYHSPKNCLPGSGWEIIDSRGKEINGNMGTISINRLIIQNGLDRQLMFYWYQDRGRVVRNEYGAKLYLLKDSILRRRSDGAMIRVIIPYPASDGTENEKAALGFIEFLFQNLTNYLPA